MKYLTSFLLALLFLLGCTQSTPHVSTWFENNGKIKVLSTTAMIDDLVGEIGKDLVDHFPLIVGQLDPHSYELVKGDDEKIHFAHLLISNGLGLEHGASMRHQLEVHPNALFLGDEIQKRVPEKILKIDGHVDPHVWMDISLWAEAIDPIVSALIKKAPDHALTFKRNGDRLRQKMLQVHLEIQAEMEKIPLDRRYLVTSHDAFNYFTRAYLAQDALVENRCVAPEGLAPEGQLSTQDIQRVIDHLCRFRIEVVFPESNVSRDALKKIVSCCSQKGLNVRLCKDPLYGDAMGAVGSGAETYLGMIRTNAMVLKEEWEK